MNIIQSSRHGKNQFICSLYIHFSPKYKILAIKLFLFIIPTSTRLSGHKSLTSHTHGTPFFFAIFIPATNANGCTDDANITSGFPLCLISCLATPENLQIILYHIPYALTPISHIIFSFYENIWDIILTYLFNRLFISPVLIFISLLCTVLATKYFNFIAVSY